MSATDRKYLRETLKQVASRLSEAATDSRDLKRLARQLRFWFGTVEAPSAQVAAARVEEAIMRREEPTRLASLVWALEHEVARLIGSVNWKGIAA